jgi:hypothetical protein
MFAAVRKVFLRLKPTYIIPRGYIRIREPLGAIWRPDLIYRFRAISLGDLRNARSFITLIEMLDNRFNLDILSRVI